MRKDKESNNAPWQFAWKRPRWHVVQDPPVQETSSNEEEDQKIPFNQQRRRDGEEGEGEEEEGTALCVASAHVVLDEIKGLETSLLQSQQEQQRESSLVLTVTVLASPFSIAVSSPSSTPIANAGGSSDATLSTISSGGDTYSKSGDLLVLEILEQPGSNSSTTADPSNLKKDSEDAESIDSQSDPVPRRLFTKTLRWPGVALQVYLQQQQTSDEEESQSWRHFLPGWLGGLPRNTEKSQTASQMETVGVVAACLCRRLLEEDTIHAEAFDAMTFLSFGTDPGLQGTSGTQETSPTKDDTSTAGEGVPQNEADATLPSRPELLLACLCSDGSVHVYSPWKLLQFELTKTEQQKQQDVFANSMSAFLLGQYIFEQLQNNIWPLSQPEASVQLTVPIRKRGSNRIAVEDGSGNTSDDFASEKSSPFWNRAAWDPSVDPFTAIYRTEQNIPTHCIAAFDYIVVAGRGKRLRRKTRNTTGRVFKEGGFMTILSLRQYCEVRTLFLPFIPTNLSPFAWGGMQFIFVFGDKGIAVAIRIDFSMRNSVVCGEAPNLDGSSSTGGEHSFPSVASNMSLHSQHSKFGQPHERKRKMPCCELYRFQILPIVLPDDILTEDTKAVSAAMITLFGSTPFASPPTLAMVCDNTTQKSVVVLQRTLESVDFYRQSSVSPTIQLFKGYRRSRHSKILAIATSHESKHTAKLSLDINGASGTDNKVKDEVAAGCTSKWCHVGQGWCFIGVKGGAFFVCWEGATSSRGAYVRELFKRSSLSFSGEIVGLVSDIIPVNPFSMQRSSHHNTNTIVVEDLSMPFSQEEAPMNHFMPKQLVAQTSEASECHADVDTVVQDAIQSIAGADPIFPSAQAREVRRFSHKEKSERLLSQVPAWSQLDDTEQNMNRLEGQVPAVFLRFQGHRGASSLLSVRRIYADNGLATPFYQILSWLSHKQDYFTAASLALDLLRDAGTLRHLWSSFDKIDEENERTELEGLLDGLIPISNRLLREDASDPRALATVTQLADMTVGCLTKGGFTMSSTLEYFLKRDQNYDSSRTCLILSAVAAQAVAADDDVALLMGADYKLPEDPDQLIHDVLWPIRCLLQVGVARKNLSSALALINAVMPDELRNRSEHKQLDPLKVCLALVRLIISAAPDATDLLFDLVDDEEHKRFWYSLDHVTQLELALVDIDGNRPLLRKLEVRMWVLHRLERCLEQGTAHDVDEMPTSWLKTLCAACLENAQCFVEGLLEVMTVNSETYRSDDGVREHVREFSISRDALVARQNSGGLDFNILIPAMLLLRIRNAQWNDGSWVSTQSILNAACYMAGRKSKEEPMFVFDGETLMKQCFLAENICAGANLIGGKNGLIVECCSILVEDCGMTMEAAEAFLLRDTVDLNAGDTAESEKVADDFELSYGHRHVLWMLQEHVLGLKTYGEFDATRGKVDPVFAARICLRTWLRLTKSQLPSASAWLASWLRDHLAISEDAVSHKRLACASLARVLIWPVGPDEGNVLAEKMKMESRFLVQLSQGCWNLTESVPTSIADELLAQDAAEDYHG